MLHNINISLTFYLLCAAHVKTILDYEGFVIALLIYALLSLLSSAGFL